MPGVSQWHRPYEVNWLRHVPGPVFVFLVYLFVCFNGAPFAFGLPPWRVLLNPVAGLFLLAPLVFG
jgi:hypothetical protein